MSRRVTTAERIKMFLNGVTNYFSFFTLIYFPLTDAEDVFRAAEGATVYLPCHSPPEDTVKLSVEWTKHTADSTNSCKWIIENSTVSPTKQCIPHFTLNNTSFTLRVMNVQPSDSGKYSCKTSRLIPPPSVDNSSSLELQVAGVSLQRLNSSINDSCIDLRCSLEGLNPELANFTWSRGGQMLLDVPKSNANISELRLCKPHWSEGDMITCHVNYSRSQTQKSIQLNPQHAEKDTALGDRQPLIIAGSVAAGLIFCIVLIIVVCKCKKQDENISIVFSNKVYENFSFAMSHQNTQSNAKPQAEECIYEN